MCEKFSQGLIVALENKIFLVLVFEKFLLKTKQNPEKRNEYFMIPHSCFQLDLNFKSLLRIDFSEDEENALFSFGDNEFFQIPLLFIIKKNDKNMVSKKMGKIKLDLIKCYSEDKYLNQVQSWDICEQQKLISLIDKEE